MRRALKLGTAVVSVGAALIGTMVASTAASADGNQDAPSSLVEDYSYPGAADIETNQHIKLISGDGHITLAPCDNSANVIRVESYNDINQPAYCFKLVGNKGLLRMEIPKVFFVWAGDKPMVAQVTVGGVQGDPVHVAANDGEPVGAADPKNHAVLLEISVGY